MDLDTVSRQKTISHKMLCSYPNTRPWMNLEDIMQVKWGIHRRIYCMSPPIWGVLICQTQKQRVEWQLMGPGGRWEWGAVVQRVWSFRYTRWESSRDLLYNVVLLVYKTVLCTLQFVKRVTLMLSVLTTVKIKKIARGEKLI